MTEIEIFKTMDVVTKTLENVEEEPDDHKIETKETTKTQSAVTQYTMNNVQKARVLSSIYNFLIILSLFLVIFAAFCNSVTW